MSRYEHKDNEYFRLAVCDNCGKTTYHKPTVYQRRSGLNDTYWVCEHCHVEELILNPVANEFELFGDYVKQRYLGQKDEE